VKGKKSNENGTSWDTVRAADLNLSKGSMFKVLEQSVMAFVCVLPIGGLDCI